MAEFEENQFLYFRGAKVEMNKKIFRDPPKEYRPVPFWSWNDRLEKEELLWQINEMDEQGWGGFFMHSRNGLGTPYLSDEWMTLIKDSADEAHKRGMGAWLYDEDKWPSGICGGEIPKLGREYRQKALLMRENSLELAEDEVELIKVYCYRKGEIKDYAEPKEISETEAFSWQEHGYTILYFYKWTQPLGPNRFNDTAWVDLLNPSVTKAFLASTYEKYQSSLGERFGASIPGIFTDESTILYWAYAPKQALPWSEYFQEYFLAFKGYDILKRLPYLFINLDGYEKIRYDFWETVTFYFAQNYVKRIYDWCQSHGLKYTGHFIAEDYFEFTMQYIGSLMPLYEYMHIPGVDHLNRNINDVMTVKQVTSVAHQLGKERTLGELFGASGQNLSFEEQKWIIDWSFIHGINFINLHLASYSMRGEGKRDYPPNLFYQQPWWEFNGKMSDYCGRLSYLLTQGERITDILVLHPIESAWCHYNPMDVVPEEEGQFDTPDTWIEYKPSEEFVINKLSVDFDRVLNTLLELHYDFDLGDEAIISRHGRIEEDLLFVGQQRYKIIMVPPCVTLRRTTVTLLQQFADLGGRVIFLSTFPTLIDGSLDLDGFMENLSKNSFLISMDRDEITRTLGGSLNTSIHIEGKGNEAIWYHLRKVVKKKVIFFANTDKDQECMVDLTIDAIGHVEEWDPLSGETKELYFEIANGKTNISHVFQPCGSLVVVIDEGRDVNYKEHKRSIVLNDWELGKKWMINPLENNCLVLDYCSGSTKKDTVWTKQPLHRVRDLLRDKSEDFILTYNFEVSDWAGENVQLAMESPECFEVRVNGILVNDSFSQSYWVDKSFKTANITGLIHKGVNLVELRALWKPDIEIEAIYILGNFTVENRHNREFALSQRRKELISGNLVNEGYPFFQGSVALKQMWHLDKKEEGRFFLEIIQEGSIVVQVSINGQSAGEGIWRPYIFDITPYIRSGYNEINVILTTSLHNLLGPHHSTKGEIIACAPASFRDEKTWSDTYNFVYLGVRNARILRTATIDS